MSVTTATSPNDVLLTEVRGRVLIITLNRPEAKNAFNAALSHALSAALDRLDEDPALSVGVLTGAGGSFSAGMDLSVFTSGQSVGTSAAASTAERGRVRANLRQAVLDIQESFNALERSRMPVLIAIQGGCVGGAVDMASACDCRYATEDAFFVIQEVNLGMTADVGTFPRLCHLLPQGYLRELAYAGRRLSAARARETSPNRSFAR